MLKRPPTGELSSQFPEFAELLDHVAVHSPGQNVKAIAYDLGVALQTFYSYTENNRAFPAKLLVPLIRSTRDPRFLTWIAEQVGCVVYPLPSTVAGSNGTADVLKLVCEAQREHCEAVGDVVDALMDGAITSDELPRVLTEIDEALGALLALRAVVVEQGK